MYSKTLIRKGKILRPFLAPIQIALDLERLILQPEHFAKLFEVLKR